MVSCADLSGRLMVNTWGGDDSQTGVGLCLVSKEYSAMLSKTAPSILQFTDEQSRDRAWIDDFPIISSEDNIL